MKEKNISLNRGNASDPLYTFFGYPSKIHYMDITSIIEEFTSEGDTILDPFAGSGSTGVASLISGRDCILNDGSYLSYYLMKNFFDDTEPKIIEDGFNSIVSDIDRIFNKGIYAVECSNCKEEGVINHTIESNIYECKECDELFSLRDSNDTSNKGEYKCPNCDKAYSTYTYLSEENRVEQRKPIKVRYSGCECESKYIKRDVTEQDVEFWKDQMTDYHGVYKWIPTDEIVTDRWYNRKNGWPGIDKDAKFTSMFSARNLLALSVIREEIEKKPPRVRQNLMLVFLSSLIRCSRRMYKTSVVKQYYQIPKIGKNQNVLEVMRRKFNTYINAKQKIIEKADSKDIEERINVYQSDAKNLSHTDDNSVDLVFLDPPYGSKISYYELNQFYTSWLKESENLDEEIIIPNETDNDPKYVKKWKNMMGKSLRECERVLKDDGNMIISFGGNTDEIWDALYSIIEDELELEEINCIDKDKQETFHMNRSSETNPKESYIILA